MKSLEEHNSEREQIHRMLNIHAPVKNGIACPDCGNELVDSNPSAVLCSYPPQKDVKCDKCGYIGYRIA